MATNPNALKPELIDELLSGRDPKTLFESEGLLDELKKVCARSVPHISSSVQSAYDTTASCRF